MIDRSGSMEGARIREARRAATMAVDRLDSTDTVSIVAYNKRVEVIVPATKVRDRYELRDQIARLEAGGSTAIYAGVKSGAAQLSEFASRNKVNRIILLSDGLANVGPKDPSDFADLGRELSGRGFSVSTIGLGTGYNEDLMEALARTGEGNHAFVQEPEDLVQFFNEEFDEAVDIIAFDVEIIITLRGGAEPIASLGRDARIGKRTITYRVGQLVGGSEQILLSEIALPKGVRAGDEVAIADVVVNYRASETQMTASDRVVARFTDERKAAEGSFDRDVMRDATLLKARAAREEAIRLRDAGKAKAAAAVFSRNSRNLERAQRQYGFTASARVAKELEANRAAAKPTSKREWVRQRKVLRSLQSNKASAKYKY